MPSPPFSAFEMKQLRSFIRDNFAGETTRWNVLVIDDTHCCFSLSQSNLNYLLTMRLSCNEKVTEIGRYLQTRPDLNNCTILYQSVSWVLSNVLQFNLEQLQKSFELVIYNLEVVDKSWWKWKWLNWNYFSLYLHFQCIRFKVKILKLL